MGEITVQDDSGPVNATVAYEDAQGNPANPADTPVWARPTRASRRSRRRATACRRR